VTGWKAATVVRRYFWTDQVHRSPHLMFQDEVNSAAESGYALDSWQAVATGEENELEIVAVFKHVGVEESMA
jgi:hypothetical protein